MTTRIILDTDLSLGDYGSEVDDGFALALALAEPEISVDLVTTVTGNTDAVTAASLTNKLLEQLGRTDIPVVTGATAPLAGPPRSGAAAALAIGAEQPLDQLRQFPCQPRPRHHQVNSSRLRGRAGRCVDVRVVAQHRRPPADQLPRAGGTEVGDDQLRPVECRLLRRAGEDHVVPGRGQGRVDPARQHQVRGDADYAGHRTAPAATVI